MRPARWLVLAAVVAINLVPAAVSADWTMYHFDLAHTANDAAEPAATNVAPDWSSDSIGGDVYAEPLVVGSTVITASESNAVTAFDATTGSVRWQQALGTPATTGDLGCGVNTGITGTPVIDAASGTLFVVATLVQPNLHFELFALDLNNGGAVLWHAAINPAVLGAGYPGFDPRYEGQRGALAIANGRIYIPFGGRNGDCGYYSGFVVGAADSRTGPGTMISYEVPTKAGGAGIWASGGPAVDGSGNLYVTTGNSFCSGSCTAYDYSESVIKLSPTLTVLDEFHPTDWLTLNAGDVDLGGAAPTLVGGNMVFQVGKSGIGYLLSTTSLGGANNTTPLTSAQVCNQTSDAAFGGTAYDAANQRLYVPCADSLTAVDIGAGPTLTVRWNGPSVSQTNGQSGSAIITGGLVWVIDPDGTLYGLNPADGSTAFSAAIGITVHFVTPSAGGGRIFVVSKTLLQAFDLAGTAWTSLGGYLTSGPDASSWGSSRLDVFVRGPNNNLYHKFWDGTTWSAYENLGGTLTSDPAAVSWGANRIDVFVRGPDNALWHKSYNAGVWSASWDSLGGNWASGPDVSSWTSGRLDVFIRGTDNAMWHTSYHEGAWHGWDSLGGSLTSDPSAVSWTSGRIDAFVRGPDNALWHKSYSATGWSGWDSLGGTLTSAPDASSSGSGQLDAFVRGPDGELWHRVYGGFWSSWIALGGSLSSGPGAVSKAPGTADVFVRGPDNALWQRTITG